MTAVYLNAVLRTAVYLDAISACRRQNVLGLNFQDCYKYVFNAYSLVYLTAVYLTAVSMTSVYMSAVNMTALYVAGVSALY